MKSFIFICMLYVIITTVIYSNDGRKHNLVYKPESFSKKEFFKKCRRQQRTKEVNKKTTQGLILQLLILSGTVERNPGPWTCTRCSQVFREQAKYQRHVENQESVSCSHCMKNFCWADRCRRHEQTCNPIASTASSTTSNTWTCTRCAQIFKEYPRFQKHLQQREPTSCRHCDKNFCRKDRCEQHERTEHTQAVRKSIFNEHETEVWNISRRNFEC